MKAFKIAFLSLLVVFAFASCTTFKATGLSVTPADQKYTVLGDFSVTVPVTEFLGGSAGPKLVNLTADRTDPAITAALQKEIQAKGGTGAINVTIVHKASFINILLNSITWNIYAPASVEISGTVVK